MGRQLEQVRYDENPALGHTDPRRTIYNPEKILNGLNGDFYSHNIIFISQDGLELGKHFHDYLEVFFTPTGEFDFRLVDLDDLETRKYSLNAGGRILIPEGVGHIVTGNKNNVLMGYGSIPFDPKRLIPCSKEALEKLASMK